jgi:glycosyltransferase involved in cell wall biosynthesis/ADP-heptose:LPS heptosyltransferase
MRLVIDLQGAQTGSRFRGIGRYSLSLGKAIARIKAKHEVIIALSDQFPETIHGIRREFSDLLPPDNVRVWHAVGPTRASDPENRWRREVSERLREAFMAGLQPDVVLVTSLFEGLGDDAVVSLGRLNIAVPTAVILYDLIPLVNPDEHFRTSQVHREWYAQKIESLNRSDLLLAISESSRQEALHTPQFSNKSIVNISGACDESFRVLPASPDDTKAMLGRLGIHRSFVMYTGGADERKNLHRLIEAFAKLPNGVRAGYQLVLAGKMPDGPVEAYRLTGRTNGLADDDLVIPGYIDDAGLMTLYNSCALFVFPSLHEGFGIPPLEAMACGAPVIGSNATSLSEVIGIPDALFNPTSVAQISAKIERALTDNQFRQKLIAHGRAHVTRFSWTKSATTALSALEGLVNPRSARVSKLLNIERTAIFRRRRLRILAIKIDHLGDFILAIPALSKLRARFPYATLEVVVGSWNVALARETNLFQEIHTYDFFRQKSSEMAKNNEDALASLLSALGEYDIALDLRRPPDTRFLLAKTRATLKIGYGTFNESIDGALDIVLKQHKDASFVSNRLNKTSISLQMLRIVDAIPADPNDFIQFPAIGEAQAKDRGSVAIFPKAGSGVREWSKSSFEQLVELLVADPFIDTVEIYFSSGREASEFVFAPHAKIRTFAGLAFSDLTRSLSRNSVCVANNSGGAHLASYLGVTSIALYSGHELASEWAPQFFDSLVIHRGAQCAPCHGGTVSDCPNAFFCLTDIEVNDVYRKIIEVIYANDAKSDSAGEASPVSLQRNTDSIVRELLSSIAILSRDDENNLVATAVAISKNHPEYSMLPNLRSFSLNETIDHRSTLVDWKGFSGIESDFRWSDGHHSAMLFECPADTEARGILLLHLACLGQQRIIGYLNGTKVVDTVESGRHVHLRIPVRNLESGLNRLEFELPDARQPRNGDPRELAIAVRQFTVEANKSRAEANLAGYT